MKKGVFIFLTSVLSTIVLILGFSILIFYRDFNLRVSEIFVAEEWVQADMVVEVDKIRGVLTPSFRALAQGGEEAGVNMFEGVENITREVQPEYIRIDHIFDDDFYGVYKEGKIDFSKLDETVDSILAMGAKPFFSLSYMPKIIAENRIDQAKDRLKWKELVKATILHYSKDKGIEGIYYEVWNEPDLESFGGFKYYGNKNYLRLYEDSALAAKEARKEGVKDFKIGGPATTGFYENWAKGLISFCEKNQLPLDFISWHRYSYLPNVFAQDVWEARDIVGKDRKYELVISEWGPNPEKSNIYNSFLAAAHAVAVANKFIEEIDLAFAFEVKDGPNQEESGWGVLSFDKKVKPRFQAFKLMADMHGSYLTISGEGSNVTGWAVKDKNGEVRLILSNYSNIQIDREEVSVSFKGLEKGLYEILWESLEGLKERKLIESDEMGVISLDFQMKEFEVLKIRVIKI